MAGRKTSKGIKISIRGTKETEVLETSYRSKRKMSPLEGRERLSLERSCNQRRVMLRACCYCKRPIALNIRSVPALPFSAATEVTELLLNAAYHTFLQCLKSPTETSREETTQVSVTHRFDLSTLNFIISTTDGHRDHPQLTPNQPFQGGSNFGDSSGPLFSIYSKVAEEEDNKVVDRWQKDADGILIFVSPCVRIHIVLRINWNTVDRSILCCCRCAPCCDRPGSEAKQSGYLCILPWKHL